MFSDEFASIIYGDKATLIAWPLKILSIYGIFAALCVPSSALIIALGKTNLSLRWTIVSAIVNIVGIIIASRWDFRIILYSQVVISVILYIFNWWLNVKPSIDLSLWGYIKAQYSAILIVVPIIIVIKLLDRVVAESAEWVIILALAFVTLYFVIAMVINKITLGSVFSNIFHR